MAAPIKQLRTLADRLPQLGAEGEWFAECLNTYFLEAPTGRTLDAVVGLTRRPGERPWWTLEGIERRDALVAELIPAHFPDAPALRAALLRYAGAGFGLDRRAGRPVGASHGPARPLMLALLLLNSTPPSVSTIRRAIASRNA